ncbi:exodeoxyribonuclease VII large subunit [Corynebacterium uterequi]|uniref:exodeoxyribonuclease VII large subunit n=1 Tax=Corynebacterium uterequi TaxID=1072256 RepID=UPI001EEDB61D|nr:exodeoxyribonuclease VII large subunit [Corynebacterium uterequi]
MAEHDLRVTNTAESAVPVRDINAKIEGWINRLGGLWVEGQLTQVNIKNTWKFSYLVLRDTEVEQSVQLTCPTELLRSMPALPKDGDRVVILGKPSYYTGRGSFSLRVLQIRQVGVGELLARIEALRRTLAAEGLFDPARKRRLPVLPTTVGLITGRGSHAEQDVLQVAKDRWEHVTFRVINTAVQGPSAVPQVIDALRTLDEDPEVDVIIIARGGGSVEDLLPFSEEALQRAVAEARTPVVSAIGHEPDNPILDNVADLRAATPTDAAKRVVPDAAEERALVREAQVRMSQALRTWVDRERHGLAALRSRPVLADPLRPITAGRDEVTQLRERARRCVSTYLAQQSSIVAGLRGQVSALGPAATLARGYSVVQVLPRDGSEPQVVTTIAQTDPGSQLRIRVSDGSITAATMSTTPAN